MIKITFKKPQIVKQHGLIQECIFVLCPYFVSDKLNTVLQWVWSEDEFTVPTHNIQSIEHVKPTDL